MHRLEKHEKVCLGKCILRSDQSIFSRSGNANTNYILRNLNRKVISEYIIDLCVLKNFPDDEKCDYAYVVENAESADGYFIELKGANITKAMRQLSSSINHLKSNITGVIKARIICSKFHKAPIIRQTNDYLQLRKLTKGDFIIQSRQLTDSVY